MTRWVFFVKMMLCVVFIFLFFLPLNSFSIEAKITNLLITNTRDNVLIYFRVNNCFTTKMEDAILAGIPTTFTFYVELYRQRKFWFDKEIADVTIKHTIKYDNVKKIFYVSLREGEKNLEQFRNFAIAKRVMSDLNGIALVPMNKLMRDNKYYVRVKAELDKVRLPLHMEYVFFFVSLWDFETDWYKEEFIY
jgi:hypothetical protein